MHVLNSKEEKVMDKFFYFDEVLHIFFPIMQAVKSTISIDDSSDTDVERISSFSTCKYNS